MSKYIPVYFESLPVFSALVDDEDHDAIMQHNWFYTGGGYAARSVRVNGTSKTIYMHRVINDTPKGLHTDHINGDKLDNRRENLRSATRSQNKINAPAPRNNRSGYKGVSFHAKTGTWQAHIGNGNKNKTLGYFKTPEEASEAYQEASLKIYGDFTHAQ